MNSCQLAGDGIELVRGLRGDVVAILGDGGDEGANHAEGEKR